MKISLFFCFKCKLRHFDIYNVRSKFCMHNLNLRNILEKDWVNNLKKQLNTRNVYLLNYIKQIIGASAVNVNVAHRCSSDIVT